MSYDYSLFTESVLESNELISSTNSEDDCEIDFKGVVGELQEESKKINHALSVITQSRDLLKKKVEQVRKEVTEKTKQIELLNSWPLQLADDAKKWISLWEGKYGKRTLNNQASQMAENVVVLNEMQMTLQYCRSMITAKRTSHQLLADEIRQHQRESQRELKRIQEEIVELKDRVSENKIKAAQDELIVRKMKGNVDILKEELMQLRVNVRVAIEADEEEQLHLPHVHAHRCPRFP